MQELIKDLVVKTDSKIILVVLDGLGGLPMADGPYKGKTELEAANTPNMDRLAAGGACGLHVPVALGITPGSGPGHLSLFGYDPLKCLIGRGILEAVGLGMEVKNTDVAVRCNYATIEKGIIKDRRAGRPPTDESRKLTERLQKEIPKIDEAELMFGQGIEHRFAVVMRFPEPLPPASSAINDTDPQKTGQPPLRPVPAAPQAEEVARVAEKLISKAAEILKDEKTANYILLRGFSELPHMPTFHEAYGLRGLAVANYPMYRGLARLIGMDAPPVEGDIEEEINFLAANYGEYDFFFMHVKKVDSYGEDGNFEGKMKKIEEFDSMLPKMLELNPDVLIITGDHSTPALLKGHSWHPVPVAIKSPYVLGGMCKGFHERECTKGELGIFPTISLMPLALANAGRLKKYGA
ncbi:MAG: 2,3-bisphosphoglycerate-independent phosphoglycerate mutase [Thermodesulfovibrionales bacterium]|nr:2,3-bisphosphoglycerate-independent phosphoglycerate mutase [Thermodesulfovibrionales bacterium]